MYATLAEKWFHGDVSTSDAERMLGDQTIGSFLVRFSTQSRGLFTISRIATNNAIHHQRILHRPLLAEFSVLDHHYKTLRQMIVGRDQVAPVQGGVPRLKVSQYFPASARSLATRAKRTSRSIRLHPAVLLSRTSSLISKPPNTWQAVLNPWRRKILAGQN
jgi:hypothetical protein